MTPREVATGLREVADELRKSVLPTGFIAEADIRLGRAADLILKLAGDSKAGMQHDQ